VSLPLVSFLKMQCSRETCEIDNGNLGEWKNSQSYPLHGLQVVPSEFRLRGFLWYTSQLSAFTMRPNHLLETALRVLRKKLEFNKHLEQGGIIGAR
jgi:hypothetical protein